jgi:hypothetical protein
MNNDDVKAFEGDKGAGKEHVRKYGSGTANAPEKNM